MDSTVSISQKVVHPVASSYDVLLQWIRDDEHKYICYDSELTGDQARQLFETLKTNTTIADLILRFQNQRLCTYLCYQASAVLQKNTVLVSLGLIQSKISAEGAEIIADALAKNTTLLETLNLAGNYLYDEGVAVLAKALVTNTHLRSLGLGWNDCGDHAALELGEALRHTNTLNELWLDWNKIGDTGARTLLNGLHKNESIINLDLSENKNISKRKSIMEEIQDICKTNLEVQLSKCRKTELISFLTLNNMQRQAYHLDKEGYATLDQIVEISERGASPLVRGLSSGDIQNVVEVIKESKATNSPMGRFLIKFGYGKYCMRFYEQKVTELRVLDEDELESIGVDIEEDRARMVPIFNVALLEPCVHCMSTETLVRPTVDQDTTKPYVSKKRKGGTIEPAPGLKAKTSSGGQEKMSTDASTSSVGDATLTAHSYAAFVGHQMWETGLVTALLNLKFKLNHPEVKELFLPDRARSLDDFLPHVCKTPVFLALLSKGFFSSKWCIAELLKAFDNDIPIVAVRVIDREEVTFKRDEFAAMCENCSVLSDDEGQEFLRKKGVLQNAVYALRKLSKTLLIDLEPRADERVLNAQVQNIKDRLHEQVKPPNSIYR